MLDCEILINDNFPLITACPASKKCDKCDYVFPTEEDCGCAGNICIPTYTPEEADEICPEGTVAKNVIDVANARPDECNTPPKGPKDTICTPITCDEGESRC